MSKLTPDLSADLVAVSDIHLASLDDSRGQILLRLLKTLEEAEIGRFILMGDIFDFCLGTTRYYQNKFKDLGDALWRLADSGTEVLFFEGNHEFDIAGLRWPGVEFELGRERILQLSDGNRLVAGHGDLIYGSSGYRAYRGLVKSAPSRFAGRFVPGRLLDHLCLNHAKNSRAKDEYRTLDHDALLSAMTAWVKQTDTMHALFGHFHVPYYQPLEGGGRLISFDSWDHPNCIVIKGAEVRRGFWRQESRDFELSPAQELTRLDKFST